MRTFTLKGLFVTAVFMVLGCLAIHAAAVSYTHLTLPTN